MGNTEAWLARYDEAVAGVLPTYFDVVADSAEGCWVTDVEGRRYLDMGSGIAVTNVGHRHPRVVAAVHAQVDTLLHTSVVAISVLSVVDLGPLEPARVVHVDGLDLAELLDAAAAGLPEAVAGVLRAAERKRDLGADRRGVDVDDARVDALDGVEARADVAAVDRR